MITWGPVTSAVTSTALINKEKEKQEEEKEKEEGTKEHLKTLKIVNLILKTSKESNPTTLKSKTDTFNWSVFK